MKKEKEIKSVVKSNRLVEAKYNITVAEKKFMCFIISLIDINDDKLKLFKVKVKEIADFLEMTHDNYYSSVKALTKSLINREIIIKDRDDELQMAWLASAQYKKGEGFVEVEISQKLRPYLLNLKKNFTTYQLRYIIKFRSIYSIRIYELLKQYQTIGIRTISIKELRDCLGIAANQYQKYSAFKKYVLTKAQNDLKKYSDISFNFREIKEGRKFTALEFTIQPNESNLEKKLLEVPTLNQPSNDDIIKELEAFGYSYKKIYEILFEFPNSRILNNINYTKDYLKKNKVKKVKGFLFKAIKEDYYKTRFK